MKLFLLVLLGILIYCGLIFGTALYIFNKNLGIIF